MLEAMEEISQSTSHSVPCVGLFPRRAMCPEETLRAEFEKIFVTVDNGRGIAYLDSENLIYDAWSEVELDMIEYHDHDDEGEDEERDGHYGSGDRPFASWDRIRFNDGDHARFGLRIHVDQEQAGKVQRVLRGGPAEPQDRQQDRPNRRDGKKMQAMVVCMHDVDNVGELFANDDLVDKSRANPFYRGLDVFDLPHAHWAKKVARQRGRTVEAVVRAKTGRAGVMRWAHPLYPMPDPDFTTVIDLEDFQRKGTLEAGTHRNTLIRLIVDNAYGSNACSDIANVDYGKYAEEESDIDRFDDKHVIRPCFCDGMFMQSISKTDGTIEDAGIPVEVAQTLERAVLMEFTFKPITDIVSESSGSASMEPSVSQKTSSSRNPSWSSAPPMSAQPSASRTRRNHNPPDSSQSTEYIPLAKEGTPLFEGLPMRPGEAYFPYDEFARCRRDTKEEAKGRIFAEREIEEEEDSHLLHSNGQNTLDKALFERAMRKKSDDARPARERSVGPSMHIGGPPTQLVGSSKGKERAIDTETANRLMQPRDGTADLEEALVEQALLGSMKDMTLDAGSTSAGPAASRRHSAATAEKIEPLSGHKDSRIHFHHQMFKVDTNHMVDSYQQTVSYIAYLLERRRDDESVVLKHVDFAIDIGACCSFGALLEFFEDKYASDPDVHVIRSNRHTGKDCLSVVFFQDGEIVKCCKFYNKIAQCWQTHNNRTVIGSSLHTLLFPYNPETAKTYEKALPFDEIVMEFVEDVFSSGSLFQCSVAEQWRAFAEHLSRSMIVASRTTGEVAVGLWCNTDTRRIGGALTTCTMKEIGAKNFEQNMVAKYSYRNRGIVTFVWIEELEHIDSDIGDASADWYVDGNPGRGLEDVHLRDFKRPALLEMTSYSKSPDNSRAASSTYTVGVVHEVYNHGMRVFQHPEDDINVQERGYPKTSTVRLVASAQKGSHFRDVMMDRLPSEEIIQLACNPYKLAPDEKVLKRHLDEALITNILKGSRKMNRSLSRFEDGTSIRISAIQMKDSLYPPYKPYFIFYREKRVPLEDRIVYSNTTIDKKIDMMLNKRMLYFQKYQSMLGSQSGGWLFEFVIVKTRQTSGKVIEDFTLNPELFTGVKPVPDMLVPCLLERKNLKIIDDYIEVPGRDLVVTSIKECTYRDKAVYLMTVRDEETSTVFHCRSNPHLTEILAPKFHTLIERGRCFIICAGNKALGKTKREMYYTFERLFLKVVLSVRLLQESLALLFLTNITQYDHTIDERNLLMSSYIATCAHGGLCMASSFASNKEAVETRWITYEYEIGDLIPENVGSFPKYRWGIHSNGGAEDTVAIQRAESKTLTGKYVLVKEPRRQIHRELGSQRPPTGEDHREKGR
ncbi:hypothetical protein BDK51DRAFT_31420 [Blyttiomyces helicus]|uniref:Uncharacterized protein n=1 Tax=Blyttiomyces helicus TaxID=388810 RepID=A0A4P9WJ43_9FUNG|nr:hypothetical protein BDK51DRAFT_31420 [Blyttiomyces helicus]|eukprot:RKO90616.1 hypothetical protein BDK51DRAFT_31420 [Blyttiomyces helicus]